MGNQIKADFSNWIHQKRLSRQVNVSIDEFEFEDEIEGKHDETNQNDVQLPAQSTLLLANLSSQTNQTMVERNSNVPFSGLTSPNISIPEQLETNGDGNDFGNMSDEQLDHALMQCTEIMNKQRLQMEA